MRVELEIWRQDGPTSEGRFETHVVTDATPEMSLLELLDLGRADLDDETAASLERDAHNDGTPLLDDLQRAVTRPGLHGSHVIPFRYRVEARVATIF